MSTSGHLFLRGASHLALVSVGGGGEERGGEKRLVEWNRTEVWRRKALQGRKSTSYWWTVVHVIDSSSYFGSGGEMTGGWDGPANVADRGEKFVFLSWKEAATPFSQKMLPPVSQLDVWLWLTLLFPLPVTFHSNVLVGWAKMYFSYIPGYIEGTSFGKGRSEVFWSLSVCFLCATWVLIVIDAALLDQNIEMPKDDHVGW